MSFIDDFKPKYGVLWYIDLKIGSFDDYYNLNTKQSIKIGTILNMYCKCWTQDGARFGLFIFFSSCQVTQTSLLTRIANPRWKQLKKPKGESWLLFDNLLHAAPNFYLKFEVSYQPYGLSINTNAKSSTLLIRFLCKCSVTVPFKLSLL